MQVIMNPAPQIGDIIRDQSLHMEQIATLQARVEELTMQLENVMVALGLHERKLTQLEKDVLTPRKV